MYKLHCREKLQRPRKRKVLIITHGLRANFLDYDTFYQSVQKRYYVRVL